jgi:hypothetical protein
MHQGPILNLCLPVSSVQSRNVQGRTIGAITELVKAGTEPINYPAALKCCIARL